MFSTGISGTKALASPCAHSPTRGLPPEIASTHEKKKEYPWVSSRNAPNGMKT